MNNILSGKLILPFSVIAIVAVIGAVFLLNQSPEPQPTPNPTPTPSPTPAPQPAVEVPKDWLTYRSEEFGFEVKYPPNYTIEKEEEDYGSYINIVTPRTHALREYTLGEESDAMMLIPRLTSEFLNLFSITNPNDRTGRSLSLEEVIHGDFSFVQRVIVGGRTGFQFGYPGPYAMQEKLKDTLLPNSDGTWFRVTWDTKFSNQYDLILSTFRFLR